MTQTGPGRSTGARRTLWIAGAATLLLAVLVGATSGIGGAIGLIGLVLLGIGVVAVVRGRARWAFIASRGIAVAVAGAGLGAVLLGALASPHATRTAAVGSAVLPAPSAPSVQDVAAAPTTAPTTATPSPTPEAVTPPTSTAPALPPAPTLVMTCPAPGTTGVVAYGQQISAAGPYTVDIDYGDGDRYSNDDRHLGAVFTHRYATPGSYTVSAVLTDAAGQHTSATCAYSWARPVVTSQAVGGSAHTGSATSGSGPASPSTGTPSTGTSSGGTASSGGGSDGDTYTNVDGNQVHSPVSAPAAPPGATAQCADGTYSFSQHRSGTCSHHGGVAAWL